MHVVDIANAPIGPTAGVIHEAGRVELSYQLHDARRVPLSPAFVVGHPHHATRMIATAFDEGLEFGLKFFGGFWRARDVRILAADVFVAARHVLPDKQTKFVA